MQQGSQVRVNPASNARFAAPGHAFRAPRAAALAADLLIVGVGVLGYLAIRARTPFGARITPDPVSYLSAARSLLRGRGFVTYAGVPYTEWPPLFPAAIAGVALLVGRVHRAVTLLNAALFGLGAVAAGSWTRRRTGSAAAGVLVAIAAARALPLVYVAVYAWSEPLYVVTTLLALFALAAYDRGGRWTAFALAVAFASAATMTRYVGIAGIAAGSAVMLLRRGATWRRRAADALLFGVLSMVPNVLWSLRNDAVSGHLTGNRRTVLGSLGRNLWLFLGTAGEWILPPSASDGMRVTAGAVFLTASIALGAGVWMRMRRRGEGEGDALRPVLPLALYLAAYSALLLASATLTPIDPIGSRLMSPLALPGIVALAVVVHAAVRSVDHRTMRVAARVMAAAAFAAWLVGATGRGAEEAEVQHAHDERKIRDWRLSSVGRYLRHRPTPGAVFSNDPWTLFMLTALPSHDAPTIPASHPAVPTAAELQDYEDYLGDGPVWVVWLDRHEDGANLPRTLVALSQRLALVPVHQGADGAVYYVTDREDPAPRGSCLPGKANEIVCVRPLHGPDPPRLPGR